MNVLEDTQIKMFAYKLKGVVAAWWLSYKEVRCYQGRPQISRWFRMKKLIWKTFCLKITSNGYLLSCQNCHQGARTIEEYITEFYSPWS